MWTIIDISKDEDNQPGKFPGEPVMLQVTIENEDGQQAEFECAENWLLLQDIHEGDEWPEDIEEIEASQDRINKMSDWMDNYYDALDEMDEE